MITIYTYFESFEDEYTAMVQTNALKSWAMLEPNPEIIVFGNNPGVREICDQYGLNHIPNVRCGQSGAPYMDSMMRVVEEIGFFDKYLCLSPNTIVVDKNVCKAAYVLSKKMEHFLLICKDNIINRNEVKMLDFYNTQALDEHLGKKVIVTHAWNDGFYLFNKGYFDHHPPFLLGRGSYESWLYWYGGKYRKSLVWVKDAHIIRQEIKRPTDQISEFRENRMLTRTTQAQPAPNYTYEAETGDIQPPPPPLPKKPNKSVTFL